MKVVLAAEKRDFCSRLALSRRCEDTATERRGYSLTEGDLEIAPQS
jgi:hypothetical protein